MGFTVGCASTSCIPSFFIFSPLHAMDLPRNVSRILSRIGTEGWKGGQRYVSGGQFGGCYHVGAVSENSLRPCDRIRFYDPRRSVKSIIRRAEFLSVSYNFVLPFAQDDKGVYYALPLGRRRLERTTDRRPSGRESPFAARNEGARGSVRVRDGGDILGGNYGLTVYGSFLFTVLVTVYFTDN